VVIPRRRNVLGRVPDRVSELSERTIGPAGLLFGMRNPANFMISTFSFVKIFVERNLGRTEPGAHLSTAFLASGFLPDVEGGILAAQNRWTSFLRITECLTHLSFHAVFSAGLGSPALRQARMPAATAHLGASAQCSLHRVGRFRPFNELKENSVCRNASNHAEFSANPHWHDACKRECRHRAVEKPRKQEL
jgi:hypothetical protein